MRAGYVRWSRACDAASANSTALDSRPAAGFPVELRHDARMRKKWAASRNFEWSALPRRRRGCGLARLDPHYGTLTVTSSNLGAPFFKLCLSVIVAAVLPPNAAFAPLSRSVFILETTSLTSFSSMFSGKLMSFTFRLNSWLALSILLRSFLPLRLLSASDQTWTYFAIDDLYLTTSVSFGLALAP